MPASFDAIVSSKSPDTSGPESVRRDTRLLLVSNDAMRARRRPGQLSATIASIPDSSSSLMDCVARIIAALCLRQVFCAWTT